MLMKWTGRIGTISLEGEASRRKYWCSSWLLLIPQKHIQDHMPHFSDGPQKQSYNKVHLLYRRMLHHTIIQTSDVYEHGLVGAACFAQVSSGSVMLTEQICMA